MLPDPVNRQPHISPVPLLELLDHHEGGDSSNTVCRCRNAHWGCDLSGVALTLGESGQKEAPDLGPLEYFASLLLVPGLNRINKTIIVKFMGKSLLQY